MDLVAELVHVVKNWTLVKHLQAALLSTIVQVHGVKFLFQIKFPT